MRLCVRWNLGRCRWRRRWLRQRFRQQFRRRRSLLLAEPERDPKNAATLLYEEMTRAVGTRGCHRLPQQTPTEFAAGIKPTELRAAIAAFTLHYERARYGESAPDAALLPRLLERVRQATRCSAA